MEMWKLLACRESLNEALITLEMLQRGGVLTDHEMYSCVESKDHLQNVRSALQRLIDKPPASRK